MFFHIILLNQFSKVFFSLTTFWSYCTVVPPLARKVSVKDGGGSGRRCLSPSKVIAQGERFLCGTILKG